MSEKEYPSLGGMHNDEEMVDWVKTPQPYRRDGRGWQWSLGLDNYISPEDAARILNRRRREPINDD